MALNIADAFHSEVEIYGNSWVFINLSEHEFQNLNKFQSKLIVYYNSELFGPSNISGPQMDKRPY